MCGCACVWVFGGAGAGPWIRPVVLWAAWRVELRLPLVLWKGVRCTLGTAPSYFPGGFALFPRVI